MTDNVHGPFLRNFDDGRPNRPFSIHRGDFTSASNTSASISRNEHHSVVATTTEEDEHEQQNTKIQRVVVCFMTFLIAAVTYDAFTARRLEAGVTEFVAWLTVHPYAGVLAVIVVYIVATVCFVPGSVLTIGVGYAFGRAFADHLTIGVALASLSVFCGASAGSISCFLLGRYLFRGPVVRLAAEYSSFRAIDRALEGNGFQIMLMLRLSPLIPYNALDYISGLTSISLGQYSLALLGLLPGTIAFCYIGATASSLAAGTEAASDNKTFRRVVLFLGLTFALAGAGLASYYSKKELDKILLEEQQQEQQYPGNRQELMQVTDDNMDVDDENVAYTTAALQHSSPGVGGFVA